MGKLLGGMAGLAGASRVEVAGAGMEQLLLALTLPTQPPARSWAGKGDFKNVPCHPEPRNLASQGNALSLQ